MFSVGVASKIATVLNDLPEVKLTVQCCLYP